jgi:N-methylhydantoinase A
MVLHREQMGRTTESGMRVGVEIGGTFTDLVAVSPEGVRIVKVPSVPSRPDEGAFAAIETAGIVLSDMQEFGHGSTVATNAVLERKGGRLAFLVTAGFRDILLIQRHDRTRIFDLFYRKPVPLATRDDTLEVPERVLSDGVIDKALDIAVFERELAAFLNHVRYDAVAICLLNSFARPDHERMLAELIGRLSPGLPVTCSSDVTREFREYERASTTTVAAYVQPVIGAYLDRMEQRLAASSFAGHFSIMQSNGGRIPASAMRRNAVTALLSGPAAGVTGAVRHVGLSGFRDVITLDIGGTSADVSMVPDGRPQLVRESRIGGLPVQMPMVDIATIGAGGGSLIWHDDGGALRVGPASSGAVPGPACYGRGGTEPTLTDAHVITGRLRPDARLAGSMPIDAAAAHAAFEPLAAAIGMSVPELADSAVRIATANVVAAIRLVSTERGRDPRGFALVPFGGAGPLHAALVAEELGVTEIVVPPNAGVISAYGLLAADHTFFDSRTRRTEVDDAAPGVVRGTIGNMFGSLLARAEELGIPGRRRLEATLDMRFVGQAFEVSVPIDPETLETVTQDGLMSAFHEEHHKIYRHGAGTRTRVEIVSFRVGLHVEQEGVPGLITPAPAAMREEPCEVYDDGRRLSATVISRSLLRDRLLSGPAVVEDTTATLWVPPGWSATDDPHGNLIMRRSH